MPLIYFLRHGQTDYNAARRIQGSLDVPINATGRAQALRNGAV
jgi:probable phosphoglycerate mutase